MSDDQPLDSRGKLLQKLRDLADDHDHEGAHYQADRALLEFLNDEAITEAFDAIEKWYA